jgi:hypothetical protein
MATQQFRTIEEIGGYRTAKARLDSCMLVVISSLGVVFCHSEAEGIERTIYWDFANRASLTEKNDFHKRKEIEKQFCNKVIKK